MGSAQPSEGHSAGQPALVAATRHPEHVRRVHALRRRRRLRASLTQAGYLAAGLVLAIGLTRVDGGPEVDRDLVYGLLVTLAAAMAALIAVVFSLLFLVAQFVATTLSPRLTLFRDDPLVWHAFGLFVGVAFFCLTTGVALDDGEVSVLIPAIALGLVAASLAVARTLQFRAFRSIEVSESLSDIAAKGHIVVGALYHEPEPVEPPASSTAGLEPETGEVRWPHRASVLQQIDVPRLLGHARRLQTVIEVRARVGQELQRGDVVLVTRGGQAMEEHTALKLIATGPQRTFDQDPLFGPGLLTEIAERALSPAVNDPRTAVQAMGHLEGLLSSVLARRLDVGRMYGDDGHLRLLVALPTWDDFLQETIDELGPYTRDSQPVLRRLSLMVDHLLAAAPATRRPALEERSRALAGD